MKQKLKKLTAAFLIAVSLAFCFSATPAEAAPARLTNVHFYRWENSSFTSFSFKFVNRNTVDGYQVQLRSKSGAVLYSTTKNNRMAAGSTYLYTFTGLPANKVTIAYIRVFQYNSYGSRVYSAWSTGIFAVPSPLNTVKGSLPDKTKTNYRLKWNMIHGSDGYKVYVTTNPNGSWYLYKTLSKDTATSVTLTSYRGSKLKTGTNYYVKILGRRRRNGQDYKVYLPSTYNLYRFYLYRY